MISKGSVVRTLFEEDQVGTCRYPKNPGP